MILAPGTILDGRYKVLGQLAEGGMSWVYEIEDCRLPGRSVLKVLRDLAGSEAEQTALEEQFTREAEILSRLSHPSLPKVSDAFVHEGMRCLVMERIEGPTLAQVAVPLEETQVRQWGLQLAEALSYLHNQGLIYRDLKPSNVMLRGERLILIDFGLARFFQAGKAQDTLIMGSPGYAAPEQYGQAQTDGRADIYSLGALLFHCATGHNPEATPFRFPPARQLNSALSRDLEKILARTLAMEPGERYPDAQTLSAALRQSVAAAESVHIYPIEEPDPQRHLAAAVAVVGAVAVVCMLPLPILFPLIATAFAPFWLWWLRLAYLRGRSRSREALAAGEEGLHWSGGQADWGDVKELRIRRSALLGEVVAEVNTTAGACPFLLQDSQLPCWTPGRALDGAESLWKTLGERCPQASRPGPADS